MADVKKNEIQAGTLPRLYKDNGDGTFAEKVAVTADDPIQLTGDVMVDTLGALNDAKVTNPDAASATIPALLRGILKALNDQTVLLQTIATNTTPP